MNKFLTVILILLVSVNLHMTSTLNDRTAEIEKKAKELTAEFKEDKIKNHADRLLNQYARN